MTPDEQDAADRKAEERIHRTRWRTPDWLFGRLHAEFDFEIDVCAEPWSAMLPRYWTVLDNALKQKWAPMRCWMNPPFGPGTVEPFLEKAWQESQDGALIVSPLPPNWDAPWWRNLVEGRAVQVRRVHRRVNFGAPPEVVPSSNPKQTAIVVWRKWMPTEFPVCKICGTRDPSTQVWFDLGHAGAAGPAHQQCLDDLADEIRAYAGEHKITFWEAGKILLGDTAA